MGCKKNPTLLISNSMKIFFFAECGASKQGKMMNGKQSERNERRIEIFIANYVYNRVAKGF